jgi:hypothetical protein
MRHEAVTTTNGRRVVLMDSISTIGPGDGGCIVISGSHGGRISGAFALKHPPALVAFNDAGGGKNGAGVAALDLLEQAGIPAITVSHDTARIGDAADAWAHGRVSKRNAPAAAAGITTGVTVAEGCTRFHDQSERDRPPA